MKINIELIRPLFFGVINFKLLGYCYEIVCEGHFDLKKGENTLNSITADQQNIH
jgi:hypothetical protein